MSMYYETGVRDALYEISLMLEFGDVDGAQRAVKELIFGDGTGCVQGDELVEHVEVVFTPMRADSDYIVTTTRRPAPVDGDDDEGKTMGELFEITEEEYNDGRVPDGWTEVGGPTE